MSTIRDRCKGRTKEGRINLGSLKGDLIKAKINRIKVSQIKDRIQTNKYHNSLKEDPIKVRISRIKVKISRIKARIQTNKYHNRCPINKAKLVPYNINHKAQINRDSQVQTNNFRNKIRARKEQTRDFLCNKANKVEW
jgi:hypothetical protein